MIEDLVTYPDSSRESFERDRWRRIVGGQWDIIYELFDETATHISSAQELLCLAELRALRCSVTDIEVPWARR